MIALPSSDHGDVGDLGDSTGNRQLATGNLETCAGANGSSI
jgi:hypothetical protein